MQSYDPNVAPNPEVWLALGEAARLQLVRDYHARAKIKTPRPEAHAAIHAAVESQLALGDPPMIRATLARLMNDGLDRHEAMHAIGGELLVVMSDFMHKKPGSTEINQRYGERLAKLTKASWHAEHADE